MTQEDKDLLLKDLCAKLPYKIMVKVNDTQGIMDEIDIPNERIFVSNLNPFLYGGAKVSWFTLNGDKIYPYLRPMSSMTEEEAKEIAILHDIKDILSVKVTSDYIDVIVDDGVCSTERRTIWYDEIISSIKIFDYLNAHHFDYRGLIEKGLALEAPKDMYN